MLYTETNFYSINFSQTSKFDIFDFCIKRWSSLEVLIIYCMCYFQCYTYVKADKIGKYILYSAKIKSIQVILFMLEWKRMRTHCCPMHVWKHGPSGYLAGQTILCFCVTDEWCDTSNIWGEDFCFPRSKPWKLQNLNARKNALKRLKSQIVSTIS